MTLLFVHMASDTAFLQEVAHAYRQLAKRRFSAFPRDCRRMVK